MACVSKIGSLYEMVTKNVIVSTTNTVFGINPRAWIALPCEGLILLKIRQVVPTAGSALPVQIAVPANSTVSTVGADTCCPVTGVNGVLVENLIETFETMQDIYSDNYGIKVYTGNCIIQLNVNPKNLSESFFDVYDRDGMKLIYSIQNSILKEMFVI